MIFQISNLRDVSCAAPARFRCARVSRSTRRTIAARAECALGLPNTPAFLQTAAVCIGARHGQVRSVAKDEAAHRVAGYAEPAGWTRRPAIPRRAVRGCLCDDRSRAAIALCV